MKNTKKTKKDIKVFLFDIDNTLYCQNSGLGNAMRSNIREWMKNNLGI